MATVWYLPNRDGGGQDDSPAGRSIMAIIMLIAHTVAFKSCVAAQAFTRNTVAVVRNISDE